MAAVAQPRQVDTLHKGDDLKMSPNILILFWYSPHFAVLLHVVIVKVDVCQAQVLHLEVVIAQIITQHHPVVG